MKKFIALFLVFSILIISGNIFAKERKGAELIIQKKDGFYERGELIAVKKNSLLLKDYASGVDVSVEVKDVKVITIERESKAWAGARIGILIGILSGIVTMIVTGETTKKKAQGGWLTGMNSKEFNVIGTVIILGLGGLGGAIIGGIVSWWIFNRQKKTSDKQDYTLNRIEHLEKSNENLLEKIKQVEERHENLLEKILDLNRKMDSLLED